MFSRPLPPRLQVAVRLGALLSVALPVILALSLPSLLSGSLGPVQAVHEAWPGGGWQVSVAVALALVALFGAPLVVYTRWYQSLQRRYAVTVFRADRVEFHGFERAGPGRGRVVVLAAGHERRWRETPWGLLVEPGLMRAPLLVPTASPEETARAARLLEGPAEPYTPDP